MAPRTAFKILRPDFPRQGGLYINMYSTARGRWRLEQLRKCELNILHFWLNYIGCCGLGDDFGYGVGEARGRS